MAARWSARFRSTTDPFGRALFASPGQIVFLEVQYVEPGTGLREIEKMALGIAAAVAFALFAALYEDASDEPLNDAANDVEHLN